jgi:hypothetical protein
MELIPTALALVAVVLLLVAVLLMNQSRFMLAGLSFLGASLVIYFRESRLD